MTEVGAIDILYLYLDKNDFYFTPLDALVSRIKKFLNKYDTGWKVDSVKDSRFSNSNYILLKNKEGFEIFLKNFNNSQVLAIVPPCLGSFSKYRLMVFNNLDTHFYKLPDSTIKEEEIIPKIVDTTSEDVFKIKIPFKKTILNFKNND